MAQQSLLCGCPLLCTTRAAALPLSSPPAITHNNHTVMSNLHCLGWKQDTEKAQWHITCLPSPEQTIKSLGKAASCTAQSDPEPLISSCPCKYTISSEIKRMQVVPMLIAVLCHCKPYPWREITPHDQPPNAFHLIDFTELSSPINSTQQAEDTEQRMKTLLSFNLFPHHLIPLPKSSISTPPSEWASQPEQCLLSGFTAP